MGEKERSEMAPEASRTEVGPSMEWRSHRCSRASALACRTSFLNRRPGQGRTRYKHSGDILKGAPDETGGRLVREFADSLDDTRRLEGSISGVGSAES